MSGVIRRRLQRAGGVSALLLLAQAAPASAGEVAVVLGASARWSQACIQAPSSCAFGPEDLEEEDRLEYSDDDAWRVAWLLSGGLPRDRVLLFVPETSNVRQRDFPAEAPGLAALPEVEASLSVLRAELGEDLDVVLYLAAHGSADGVHLEDRFYAFSELVAGVEVAAGGEVTALIADACLSARWPRMRGASEGVIDRSRFPAIEETGRLEASVDTLTPEHPALKGGHFTHLVTSALVGAGDWDGSGEIDAQELSDFVFAYLLTAGVPYDPVIGAPDPKLIVQGFTGPAGLALDGQGDDARWFVTLEQVDGHVTIAEVFTRAGELRLLNLPPGDYTVWRVPYEIPEDRRRYFPRSGEGAWCGLTLAAGATVGWSDCAGSAKPWNFESFQWRGDSAAPPATDSEAMIAQLMQDFQAAVPDLPPRDFKRYHAGQLWLQAGASTETGVLDRGGLWSGASAGLRASGVKGDSQLLVELEGLYEIGGDVTSQGQMGSFSVGYDKTLATRRSLRVGGLVRPGVGALGLQSALLTTPTWQTSLLGALDFGTSASLEAARWAARVEVGWAPRVVLVDDDESGAERKGSADLLRAGLTVQLERRLRRSTASIEEGPDAI